VGGGGDSTFTFSTISPGATISARDGTPQASIADGRIQFNFGLIAAGRAYTKFTATTPTAPLNQDGLPAYGYSDYAFLQTVQTQRTLTTSTGQILTYIDPANDGKSWHLDDGEQRSVAYPAVALDTQPPPNPKPTNYGGVIWDDTNPKTVYVRTADGPHDDESATANTSLVVKNEPYKMYLMFEPPGGVWIALAYVAWGWSASATGGPDAWMTSSSIIPVSVTTPLSGGEEFPKWSGRISNADWM